MSESKMDTIFDKFWEYSILLSLCDNSGLEQLDKGVSLVELSQVTGIDTELLEHMLSTMVASGLVHQKESQYELNRRGLGIGPEFPLQPFCHHIHSVYHQSADFLKDISARSFIRGWHQTNETLLQRQGSLSEVIITHLLPNIPIVHQMLAKENSHLLDIGAGTAKISLKACEVYPLLSVTAVEPADAPHALAEKNIAKSHYHDRVCLKKRLASQLDEIDAFDVIWFPQFFISDEEFEPSLQAAFRALKPGGYIVNYVKPYDEKCARNLSRYLYGYNRTPEQLVDSMTSAGFITPELFHLKNQSIIISASK